MNVKNYLTIAGILGIIYGLSFFIMPEKIHEIYGSSEMMSPLTVNLLKFLGAGIFAGGVMSFMGRTASMSIGRKAILIYLSIAFILYLYLNIMSLVAGTASTANYVDLVVSLVLGLGGLYFLMKEKTSGAA